MGSALRAPGATGVTTDPVDELPRRAGGRLPAAGSTAATPPRRGGGPPDHLARPEHRAAGLPDADAGRRRHRRASARRPRSRPRWTGPRRRPLSRLLREAARSLVLLGAVGLLAHRAQSGCWLPPAAPRWGTAFVSGDGPDVTYSATRCADLQEYHPSPTCEQAATGHRYDEVVGYRLAAGVLGLVVLGGWLAVVRPWRRGPSLQPFFPVVRSGGRRHGLRGGRRRAAADRCRRGGAVRHRRRGRRRAVRRSRGRRGSSSAGQCCCGVTCAPTPPDRTEIVREFGETRRACCRQRRERSRTGDQIAVKPVRPTLV